MAEAWASIYYLAPFVPVLLLAGTTTFVYRLARRIRTAAPGSAPPWRLAALHAALVIATALPGGALTPLGIAANLPVPLVLLWRRRRLSAGAADATSEAAPEGPRRSAKRLAWLIGATGALAPWLVGLGVKFYLQSRGQPTYPVRDFLAPGSVLPLLGLSLLNWSSPLVVLALITPFALKDRPGDPDLRRRNLLLIRLAWVAGLAGAVPVFRSVFWRFDGMYLLVPVGLYLVPPMVLASGAGWIVWRIRHRGGAGRAP